MKAKEIRIHGKFQHFNVTSRARKWLLQITREFRLERRKEARHDPMIFVKGSKQAESLRPKIE